MMPNEPSTGLFLDEFESKDPLPENLARAQCDASDKLNHEIRRWLNQEVEGRSCLIAGPRGSGKTTLINIARLKMLHSIPGVLPVIVRLHGPSLLRPYTGGDRSETVTQSDLITQNVLRSLVINLYQTVAEEFATAYRELMQPRTPDDHERAAQLRLSLDGAPSAATIREFWESAGAMHTGVLFHPRRLAGREEQEALDKRPDQAKLEIVAIATAAEAYRSCTGKFERSDRNERTSAREQELRMEASTKGKELAQALVSVLSGLAVGGAFSAVGRSIPTSAVAGAFTAFLSMAAITYTSSFKRQSSEKQEITFLEDLSITGLVHRFPLLLRRLRQAGVAPIFVIDEIDKVRNSADSLTDLVTNLKFLCADTSFFCFLTDRAYLSEVAQASRDTSNSALLTVYTNLLFVLYETSSFAKYLQKVIEVKAFRDSPEYNELVWDKEALRLFLVHRSRMLAFNLVREVSELRQGNRLNVRQPRKRREYQIFIVMQLAVEAALSDALVSERIRQDPDFGQIIYDALYYPSRIWYQGQEDMDCSLQGLMDGMNSFNAPGALTSFSRPSTLRSKSNGYLGLLKEDDKKFLHAQVRKLLGFVCEPNVLYSKLMELIGKQQIDVSPVVAEICLRAPVLLVRTVQQDAAQNTAVDADKYSWRYNWYGIPFKTADIGEIAGTVATAEELLDGLTAQLAGLSTVPSVANVMRGATQAIGFLEDFQSHLP